MKVTRRTFLKNLLAGTFIISFGIGLSDLLVPKPINAGSWVVDIKKKLIRHISGTESVSLSELSNIVSSFWDTTGLEGPLPIINYINNIYRLDYDWRIEDRSFEYLKAGSIVDCFGNEWCGVATRGDYNNKSSLPKISILQEGVDIVKSVTPVKSDIEIMIKTRSEDKLINGGYIKVVAENKRKTLSYYERISIGNTILPINY